MKFLRMYHRRLLYVHFHFSIWYWLLLLLLLLCKQYIIQNFCLFVWVFNVWMLSMSNALQCVQFFFFFLIFETSLKKKLKKWNWKNIAWTKYENKKKHIFQIFKMKKFWKKIFEIFLSFFVCFSSTIFRFFWSITQFIWFAFVFATGYVVYDFLFCPKKK